MKNELLFSIGEPVAICAFTNLASSKIAQVEKTFYFNEQIYLPCRILMQDNYYIKIPKDTVYILVITPIGFVISVEKSYITKEPLGKIDANLKEQEYNLLSQNITPYDGRLVKYPNDEWFLPITI